VVAAPEFPELEVRIGVAPSPASWAALERLAAEQGGLCEAALERVDLRGRIERIVARGFEVRLPRRLFAPVRLPAGIQKSVAVGNRRLTLSAEASGLVVGADRLWCAAKVRAAAQAGP
jgi:hypothetical protein